MKNGFKIAALTLALLAGTSCAKAEEAKAKAAEVAKRDAELLAKAQDRVVARYVQQQKTKGVTVTPTAIAPPAGPAVGAPAAPVKPSSPPPK